MVRRPQTYLDYNATAPVRPEAADAVADVLASVGNPSSVHGAGRAAKGRLETARRQVATLVGASPKTVVFTSGGTEANNQALKGVGAERLIISVIEHDSVRDIAAAWDGPVEKVPVDANGCVRLDALEEMLRVGKGRALVSVMLANNETGVIQPLAEIAALVRDHGALTHTDAVQAAGKIPVDFTALGVDLMTLSAHKLGGPQGVGALLVREGLAIKPLIRGGGQELRRRSGTENVPGIAGFGMAADIAQRAFDKMNEIAVLRDRLEAGIFEAVPEAVVFGAGVSRLPTTTSVAVPGVASETQVMALDLEDICVSAGSACSSGKVTPSHVLAAMGADGETARSAIRISLGWASTAEDVARFLDVWPAVVARLQGGNRAERCAS